MRLQTLYLPHPDDGDAPMRFALIADRVTSLGDGELDAERAESFFEFARRGGAVAAWMTPDVVEIDDTPLPTAPAPLVGSLRYWREWVADALRERPQSSGAEARPQ